MSQQLINFGTAPSGADGDNLRIALGKLQANDTELYSLFGGTTGFKNGLINPNFLYWQRGTAVTVPASVGTYVCDRWTVQQASISGLACGQGAYSTNDQKSAAFGSPYYLSVGNSGNTDAAAHLLVFAQKIENVVTYAGKTRSVRLDVYNTASFARSVSLEFVQSFGSGGSATILGILPASPVKVLQPGWNTVTWTVTIPAIAAGAVIGAGNHLQMIIWLSAGSNFSARTGNLGAQSGGLSVGYVAFEPGSMSTDVEIRPPGLELTLCQRYYEKSFDAGAAPADNVAGAAMCSGVAYSTSLARMQYTYKVTKRASPTVTFYAPNNTTPTAGKWQFFSGSWSNASAMALVGSMTNFAIFDVGGTYVTNGAFIASGHLTADAEL